MLGIAPGGKFSFERPPFKLTAEVVNVLGGWGAPSFKYVPHTSFSRRIWAVADSRMHAACHRSDSSFIIRYYVELIYKGFKVARQHAETLLTLMEIMAFQSKFPCFVKMGPAAISGFRSRIMYGQELSDAQLQRIVEGLVR